MTTAMRENLFNWFGTSAGQRYIDKIKGVGEFKGSPASDAEIGDLLKAFGSKKPGQSSIDSVRNIAGMFQGKSDFGKSLGKIATGNPYVLLARGILDTVGEGTKTASRIVANNSNRLADMLLQSGAGGTDAQNHGGTGIASSVRDMLSTDKRRRGENVAEVLNGIGNLATKAEATIGGYDDMVKTMQMQNEAQAPGLMYNYLTQQRKARQALGI